MSFHRYKGRMAEWLDHLTLFQRVPGSKPPSDLSKSGRRELASSRAKGKGITKCGHIERRDQGHTAQLVYLFSGPFVLRT